MTHLPRSLLRTCYKVEPGALKTAAGVPKFLSHSRGSCQQLGVHAMPSARSTAEISAWRRQVERGSSKSKEAMSMATKRSSKAVKSAKNRSKRIPSVKRLEGVRTLQMRAASVVECGSYTCPTH
jgi:hypothetical protein